MEAYSNCREFNCVTPIMEQSEYHMFCRERAELYLPEMYNKIGVGLMAWGPLGMYLTENTERLFFSKGSLRSKTQNSSWTEDEVAKEVSNRVNITDKLLIALFVFVLRIASRRPNDTWRKFAT